jgi:hypothetical protein
LNEAQAKMRTFYSSQITHWEMSAKAIFESMGIGIHVLYPIALPHILGIRLGVHPFDLYGTNKPMKKKYSGDQEIVFKSGSPSERYSDVSTLFY